MYTLVKYVKKLANISHWIEAITGNFSIYSFLVFSIFSKSKYYY